MNTTLENNSGTTAGKKIAIAWPQIICGLLGLGLAVYTLYLHKLIEAGASTGCGISDTISCDKVIGSKPWGAPFGIPLGVFGSVYFVIVLLTAFSPAQGWASATVQRLGVATVGIVFSLGLEYVMWGILHHGCPVCIMTHVVTLVNFVFALAAYFRLGRSAGLP